MRTKGTGFVRKGRQTSAWPHRAFGVDLLTRNIELFEGASSGKPLRNFNVLYGLFSQKHGEEEVGLNGPAHVNSAKTFGSFDMRRCRRLGRSHCTFHSFSFCPEHYSFRTWHLNFSKCAYSYKSKNCKALAPTPSTTFSTSFTPHTV